MEKHLEDLKKQISDERRWYHKSLGILTYHTLMQAQRLGKRNDKWRVEDSAKQLNLSIGYISESLKLAKFCAKIEDLKLLTREDALRKIREREE